MLIRREKPSDIADIFAVHAKCFTTELEAKLVDMLRSAARLPVSLVAESDGQIVGHIAFSPVTTATGQTGIGLAPLAVLEAERRRGVGAALVEQGLAACGSAGFRWAVVLGEPAYYGRFGFRPAQGFGLSDEYGGGEYFQVVELASGGIPRDSGLVQYAPEFASVEP